MNKAMKHEKEIRPSPPLLCFKCSPEFLIQFVLPSCLNFDETSAILVLVLLQPLKGFNLEQN